MVLKIAITGAGYISNIHAKAIQNLPGVEICALVNPNTPKLSVFADKYSIPNTYQHIEDMLNDQIPDAVIIGTPNYLHAPQAIAAIRAGAHVMVEKPMAIDAAEAALMAETAEREEVRLMVAHCWRFDEEVLWLKDQVQTGKLGNLIRTKGYGVHTNWGPAGWFTEKKYAGGGALADMGIHAIDTVRFLLGDPAPVSVYAQIGTYYRDFDVDDTGVIIVNWDNGVCSYIESGWWQPHSDGPEACTCLYGNHGYAQIYPTFMETPDPENQVVDRFDPGFVDPRPEHCPQVMYDRQLEYFVQCIRNEYTPSPGAIEGLINMRIVDAAYRSAQVGGLVFLTDV